VTKTFEHEADGRPTGDWFGHSGFNSGYLTLALGSKTNGCGVVVMANIAPEDMCGDAPQCCGSEAADLDPGARRFRPERLSRSSPGDLLVSDLIGAVRRKGVDGRVKQDQARP
jgi:hypothetical protein